MRLVDLDEWYIKPNQTKSVVRDKYTVPGIRNSRGGVNTHWDKRRLCTAHAQSCCVMGRFHCAVVSHRFGMLEVRAA